jgi:uncharacterized protein YneF (UPF0154 family)
MEVILAIILHIVAIPAGFALGWFVLYPLLFGR